MAPPPEPPVIDHQPAPDAPSATTPPKPASPPPARRGGTPFGVVLLFVIALGGGIYYVWTNPKPAPVDAGAIQAAVGAAQERIEAELQPQIQAAKDAAAQATGPLHDQITALADRIDKLEKAPPPAPAAAPAADANAAPGVSPDAVNALSQRLDQLAAKLDALASRPEPAPAGQEAPPQAPPPAAPPADSQALASAQAQLAALGSKLDQVEQAQKAALSQTEDQQKSALEQEKSALDQQKSVLEQEKSALEQQRSEQEKQQSALEALTARLSRIEQGTGKIATEADLAARAARLDEARAALAAGKPLGDIAGAPPALAKFAKSAPPTDAALRESFPAVADHAREVSQPQTANESFWTRVLARMQQTVVVRRGDDVIVGDPAAGVLTRATDDVNRDDLAGAVQALGALQGPAAQAVSGWVAQARSLLDARAALANLSSSAPKAPVQ
jgi:hypothetical protein